MEKQLLITSSPHLRAPRTTRRIMTDVCLALMPALLAATLLFGYRAFLLCAVCVAGCVLFEYGYRRLAGLPCSIKDGSAAVTGLLLAFNLPAGLPVWMALIGCFVAIVVVKQLFGGLGRNFANPAIVGRIVLLISFAKPMTTWAAPLTAWGQAADTVTGATPLALAPGQTPYAALFFGTVGGSLGETCKLALLLGFGYLLWRRVITATTPLAFAGTVFLCAWALGQDPVFHLLSGGLLLGAIFMATDYVTTPVTEKGKLIFGVGCGLLTILIRLYAAYPEGVSFSILLMNIVTPHIDRLCTIKALGGSKA